MTQCSAQSRPWSAAEQRETFQSALCGTLEGACSMEVVQSVHDYLRQRIQEHKESRDPEPLAVTAGEVSGVLRNCGVPEERVEAFQTACGQSFGEGALTPANLIDAKHFAVKTADATIQVDPERSYLVEARIIDGRALPAGPGGRECGGQRSGGPDCRRQRRRRDYINREEGIC